MTTIDNRQGSREFRVPTAVVRNGVGYMGPDVLVTARDSQHAAQIVQQQGHQLNEYFPTEELRKR